MVLTVFYDGQFWVGIIEWQEKDCLKAFRYVFGPEPSDIEVLEFVNHRLLSVIEDSDRQGIKVNSKLKRKLNPKRLQRQVAREMKELGVSTKAQEAIKEDLKLRKEKNRKLIKERRKAAKQEKWELKKQQAKQKHRGH